MAMAALVAVSIAANVNHFVPSLPGQANPFKPKWYSGFYNVSTSRHLHYLFIESLSKPETDPVLVYFNGGPGVSSVVMAFIGMGSMITDGTD